MAKRQRRDLNFGAERIDIRGDVVGAGKYVNENYYGDMYADFWAEEAEKKSGCVFLFERLYVFVFTLFVAGIIFTVLAGIVLMLFSNGEGGEMMILAPVIGIGLATLVGFVNAGNVKRTKGIF